MKKSLLFFCLSICSFFIFTNQALAAVKDYIVAPFNVNGSAEYEYLEEAIPGMLTSRLFWSEKFETSEKQEQANNATPPADRSAAEKLLQQYGVDYIFYGNITVLGNQASIDMSALSSDGQIWQNSRTANINNLIAELQILSDTFSRQVFSRPIAGTQQTNSATVPLSGEFVVNETGTNNIYLNPSFRYEGQESENRLRSNSLPFATVSMDVGDIDGDGGLDFVFAEDGRHIYAYAWNGGAMAKIAEYELPSSVRTLAVRTFEQRGKTFIALSAFSDLEQRPLGYILEYNNGTLTEFVGRLPYYLNTARIPGTSRDMLIAQGYSERTIFHGPVFELYVNKGEHTKGPVLPNLPNKANVYNFEYFPENTGSTEYKVVMLSSLEKLQVFSATGTRLHETNEVYSGGNAYIRSADGGLSVSDSDIVDFYYIPMRMVSMDLDRDGVSELLTNKPISTAASFFKNFRNYPQGEIHSMLWDGVGLSLLWKTKRISGTVADFQVGDPNGDGVEDLITCVVTYPGALGLGDRRTVITLYPLDTNYTDPNTPVSGE